tara:strand:+ start:495 stop:713 length:219 start_codon:yes stop_codon:yes gene_type:complete
LIKNGGDGEIRTLERLPFTRFPGVLLQPLGHVTYLFFNVLSSFPRLLALATPTLGKLFKRAYSKKKALQVQG